ncbi:uncharacterized protein [Arachis hypogaea]|uniref:uncharacterized protein n=1 Tax=Arachis hypogaea TaxID=3818 RepID=UPI003B226C94
MAPYEAMYGRMLTSQSRQKSYADQRQKPLEFKEGDHLRKYTPYSSHVLEPESVRLRKDLTLQVTLVRIDDISVKKLCENVVSLVKLAWSQAGIEKHTWELESEMRTD